ncbi:GatB/YqeY domain-containing protein [Enorma phocaeensis]|uniref:GatB/YqeY domain-containing protein n=1 Tax=Enorma phocaeensis TaxID=1871019 RepID=A0ABT7VAR3_9ACTN|nr:GatB/YqeY domain-containing protein [Enorma phocaeensis]MBM6952718.1 GatB/YqeY domain-containing protein [Enorma phocaeensis]MDM8275589.1 GatB/YqeY domain-containing protein [Enorma phocaeensis]
MTNQELHDEMVAAMKAKDKTRLSIIRQVMAEVKNVEVNERRDATEEDVTSMVKRLIKQTSETLEMSIKAANNQERTDTLTEQVKILESLLPAQLSGDELVALIEQTIAEVGATTRKDMGRVMGALNKATGGNFDKAAAAKEVGARLA